MDLLIKDKTAFISGSTAGIGLATAKSFLNEGAEVIINGRTQEAVDKIISELSASHVDSKVSGIAADFSKTDEVNRLIKLLPDVDILINNVAIFKPMPFGEIPDEDWFRYFEVNVMSGVRLARHLFPKMLKKNWGRIIFISSESAVNIPEDIIPYGVTKTAQIAVSRGLAELTKGTGVTVNSILPGPTRSSGMEGFLNHLSKANDISIDKIEQDFFKNTRPSSLLQRFSTVDEVANTVVYFASPLSSATNGAAIRVDGGVVRSIL